MKCLLKIFDLARLIICNSIRFIKYHLLIMSALISNLLVTYLIWGEEHHSLSRTSSKMNKKMMEPTKTRKQIIKKGRLLRKIIKMLRKKINLRQTKKVKIQIQIKALNKNKMKQKIYKNSIKLKFSLLV